MERLSSDLSSLAFEHKQERLEWRRAMEAQAAEIQQLIARQDAMQVRQDDLETIAIEIEDQLQGDVKELSARLQSLSERIDRLEKGHERQEDGLGDLRRELAGLSRTTDEVFDDIADRVGIFERTLAEFDHTLSKQYEVLTEGLQEARDQLIEGLAEALEAAQAHSDGIIELKDAIATYQERRDQQDADSREKLAAMGERLAEQCETIDSRQEKLERNLVERMESHTASLHQLDTQMAARLTSQDEMTRSLTTSLGELRERFQGEIDALGHLITQIAAQGQMLTQALESVQQGSMTAEQELGTAMREQFETLLRHLEQSTSAWQESMGQTQHHLKEFEAKVAKALGLQRNENLEQERLLTALKDDLATLRTRVATIVQLLTKASRPTMSGIDPS